jgi:dTMP kinase
LIVSAGRFITLEGIDGAGKSTHIQWIGPWLHERGIQVCQTREPGGTPMGELLRTLLLDPAQQVDAEAEVLLMFAARKQHLVQVIEPALARGDWVLCDRFTDATFAYQGGGRGIATARLEMLEAWIQGGRQPDLTLYFDLPIDVARTRLLGSRMLDRFEQEQAAFFERVRAAYLDRARQSAGRMRVVDSTCSIPEVKQSLMAILAQLMGRT